MKRDKAIDLIDNLIGMVEDNSHSDYDTALKMAIKALEQEPTTKNDLGGEAMMTRFDAIKQMNVEDLAFFLSIVELGDLNSIPNIANEDINYYINYLKEEDNGLIDALHKSNKSRHDYKEIEDGNDD